jgi:hypothetical protein
MAREIKKLSDLNCPALWYRKKPVEVQAVLLDAEVEVHTREGVVKGYPGDYIIQGIQGEIYPCGRDIFHKTYERV